MGTTQLARGERLSIALLVGSSVAVLPWAFTPHTWVKLLVISVAVALALWKTSPVDAVPRPLALAGVLLIAWLSVATLLSSHPGTTLVGRWPRFEGVIALVVYALTALAGARLFRPGEVSKRARTEPHWAWLHVCLAWAAIVVLVVAVIQVVSDDSGIRAGSTLGNATDMALWAVLALGALLPRALQSNGRLVRVGALAAGLVIAISGSRAGYVAFVVVLAGVIAWMLRHRAIARTTLLGIGVSLAGVVGIAAAVPSVRGRLLESGTVSGRWLVWRESVALGVDNAGSGVGLGGYVDAIPGYHTAAYAESVGLQMALDSPHMWPLQVLSAGGAPGLVLSLVVLGLCVWYGREALRRADEGRGHLVVGTLAGVTAYGVGLMTHFTSPTTTPLAALLVGAALATAGRTDAALLPRWLLRPALVLLVSLLGLSTMADLHVGTALRAVNDAHIEQAAQSFDQAALLAPWNPDIPAAAAQALARRATDGDVRAGSLAVDYADRALAVIPESVEVGLAKGTALNALGRPGEAKALLDALDRRAPHHYVVLVQRGIAWFGEGNTARALADLKLASEAEPRSPTPWVVMSRIHALTGNESEATAARAEAEKRSAGPR